MHNFTTTQGNTNGCERTRPQTNPPPAQPARKYILTRPQMYQPPNEPAPRLSVMIIQTLIRRICVDNYQHILIDSAGSLNPIYSVSLANIIWIAMI